jgi:hypothetical protein
MNVTELLHPKFGKMTDPFLSFEQMAELYTFEQDWLFEKFLVKLNTHRHLLLTADQHWGIEEYVKELGFQLEEEHRDIQICYVDVRLAQTSTSFLKLFQASLFHKFQELESMGEVYSGSLASLKLPSIIARKKRIRVGIFLSNSHLFHRFKDADSFLRTLRLYFQNQKKCIFCLYGNDTSYFRELVHTPGPLSGLGQLFELRHDPTKHRSASIRKLFHDHNKRIAYTTSIHMSYIVDNHPFYLKLLAWHALIRTRNQCTEKTVDKALNDLILHFEDHFLRTLDSLTIKQLSFLKAAVEVGYKLCSGTILKAYQLGSSGNVNRIKQSLEKKGIIVTAYHDTVFVDPVFREWLKYRYFKIDSVPHFSDGTL